MASWFDLNCVPLVEPSFAAFLKDDQGRTNNCCDVPSLGCSNSAVHSVVRQFPCRQGATQLEQTHLVSSSKYSFTIISNWNYGIVEYQSH